MNDKLTYETPSLEAVGGLELVTQGSGAGLKFDGNFTIGQPVPFDPSGRPLIFS